MAENGAAILDSKATFRMKLTWKKQRQTEGFSDSVEEGRCFCLDLPKTGEICSLLSPLLCGILWLVMHHETQA